MNWAFAFPAGIRKRARVRIRYHPSFCGRLKRPCIAFLFLGRSVMVAVRKFRLVPHSHHRISRTDLGEGPSHDPTRFIVPVRHPPSRCAADIDPCAASAMIWRAPPSMRRRASPSSHVGPAAFPADPLPDGGRPCRWRRAPWPPFAPGIRRPRPGRADGSSTDGSPIRTSSSRRSRPMRSGSRAWPSWARPGWSRRPPGAPAWAGWPRS